MVEEWKSMGKRSRLNRNRKNATEMPNRREARRHAQRVDRRGRRVQPTIEAYERVAGLGSERVIEALIARYTARMEGIPKYSDFARVEMISCLAPIAPLGKGLVALGASTSRPPSAYIGTWVDHLMWGVDSSVASVRLMLCGQYVGAAALARNQLERWLVNRAQSAGLSQEAGEDTQQYIARVWSAPDALTVEEISGDDDNLFSTDGPTEMPTGDPPFDHDHVELSDGTSVCPAVLYGLLSELLHGRELTDALKWEANDILYADEIPEQLAVAIGATADTISICLRQVRIAAISVAERTNNGTGHSMLSMLLDRFSHAEQVSGPAEGEGQDRMHKLASPPLYTLMPLLPNEGLSPPIVAKVDRMAQTFVATMLGARPAGRLFRDDELTSYAFAWHRARSIRTAQSALAAERDYFGDAFDEELLTGRAARWQILAEASSLLGFWRHGAHQGAAMMVVGSGLRSAYWLWLEDDDRAMAVLRSVLEQTARCKVWRTKPEKAARLESRDQTRPRDWLEAAGWGRLRALNRALGEFAHVKETSKWPGARELLASLQLEVDEKTAIQTARGAALEFVSLLVASEVLASSREVSSVISAALSEEFEIMGLSGADITDRVEDVFNHIWSQRISDLGAIDPWLTSEGVELRTER